jgi:hypothetical protein
VALGTLGKREREAGDPQLSVVERPIVRRQVARIVVEALAMAAAATAVALLV